MGDQSDPGSERSGAELPTALPSKKNKADNILTIFSDRCTVKFMHTNMTTGEDRLELVKGSWCHDRDLLQPSPTHSRAHKLNPETLHSFPTQNTRSRSCSNTSDLIGLTPIACTYLLLVLVLCLSLPLIRYLYLSLIPSV